MRPAFERLPAPGRGRLLLAGDVHGRFGALLRALDRLSFDAGRDRLVLLGDLINKGPESHQVGMWLDHPRVLGNHEDAMSRMGAARLALPIGDVAWLRLVGDADARADLVGRLGDAPVMIEAATPGGRRVGLAHACVPFMDWTDAVAVLSDPGHPQHRATRRMAMTDRDQARRVMERRCGPVAGIDHVFLGHTPQEAPRTHGNVTLLDTGRSRDAPVTVVDVDEHLDEIERGGAKHG